MRLKQSRRKGLPTPASFDATAERFLKNSRMTDVRIGTMASTAEGWVRLFDPAGMQPRNLATTRHSLTLR
jgi:hypothetical protein